MDTAKKAKIAEYLLEVDDALLAKCGVKYSNIFQDVHGTTVVLKENMDNGVASSTFVDNVIADANLLLVGSRPVGDVSEINIRRAALVAFVAENGDWFRTDSGGVVRSGGNDKFYSIDVARGSDRWGFVASELSGELVSERGGVVTVPADVTKAFLGPGFDIVDAVDLINAKITSEFGVVNDSAEGLSDTAEPESYGMRP